MSLKHIEILKNFQDNDISFILNESFKYYISKSEIDSSIRADESHKKLFSTLIRFYRSINTNKKIEEETFNQQIKDILKGKESSMKILNDIITYITSKQTQRLKYNDITRYTIKSFITNKTNYVNDFVSNIKNFRSISWKLNINISSIYSNRVVIINNSYLLQKYICV